MYANFITQNSSSPYYHSLYQNGTTTDTAEREQGYQTTLGQSISYGLNFSHYVNSISLSQMIRSQKLNNIKQGNNLQAGQNNLVDLTYQNNQPEIVSPQTTLGIQREEQYKDIQTDQLGQNQSKSFKRIKSDQNIISSFAKSTPQFYNINKHQQLQHQQNSNQQVVTNESNSIQATNIRSYNQVNNPTNLNVSDKDKLNQISKIYSSNFQEAKKGMKKNSLLQSDPNDKRNSPQIEKMNKVSQNMQGSNFIEQQFYSTSMPTFQTKVNNTNGTDHNGDNKQIYLFQQQTINLFGKKKKAPSIPSNLYQGTQINLNIDQSQRSSVIEENESNNSFNGDQTQQIANKQQSNIGQFIKSDKRNSFNTHLIRNDSKLKGQQIITTIKSASQQAQINEQNQTTTINIPKKQKSFSQKNFLVQHQPPQNNLNSPISNKSIHQQQQQHLPNAQYPSFQQVSNTLTNSSLMYRSERLSEVPSSFISYKNSIIMKQQQINSNANQIGNKNLFDKQKNLSLSKYQVPIQQNGRNLKNGEIQFNKSSSTIIHQTSQNLKSQEGGDDSDEGYPFTDHIKKSPSFYKQKIFQQQQLNSNQQKQSQIRKNKGNRSQESSPQLTNKKSQYEAGKIQAQMSQIQNNINKLQGALNLSNNLRRQSSFTKQKSSNESDQPFMNLNLESKNIVGVDQIQSPKRKTLDKIQEKPITSQASSSDGYNRIQDGEKKIIEIRNIKSELSRHEQQINRLNYSTTENAQKHIKGLSNHVYMNIQNNDEKPLESHRIIHKKSQSQKINIDLQDQLMKKANLNQPFSQFVINKQGEDQTNQAFEIKKIRNMSQTQLSNNSNQVYKRDQGNKTIEGILYEQKSFTIEKSKQQSRSPLKNYQKNIYQEGQFTDSTAVTLTHQAAAEEEDKKPLQKYQEVASLYKNQKNSSLHYQPTYKGDDHSPPIIGTTTQNYKQKSKPFSEKIQELRDTKKEHNQEKQGFTGSFTIQLKKGNDKQEFESVPSKSKIQYQYNNTKQELEGTISNEVPVSVPQQIYEAIAQISTNRPKTSEGGSRKRGSKLYSKIRCNNNQNCFSNNDQHEQIESGSYNLMGGNLNKKNSNDHNEQEENKLGQSLQKFYATHHPSMISSKLGSQSSSLQCIFKIKSQNERNVYENIGQLYSTEKNNQKGIKNQEGTKIQQLLVDDEHDLGIEEFQIEEINDDVADSNDTDNYAQTKKRQQELTKNNNFIQEQTSNSNKILIRHNKSQNQKKRQISSRQTGPPEYIQDKEEENIHKPKGSHLQTDFLSLFAQ